LLLCRRLEMPHATDPLALLAALQGRPHTAARLLGHARETYRRLGTELPETDDPAYARAEALVRAALPAWRVERLLAEGAALDAEAAERLLLAPGDRP
jgi:hypothetical protein